ncbi:hypothetical protein K2173_011223 [Erythroxylum novogranatense]|uniref:Uncharacterized protein n=1 Tax=Erythroxylum novogranatense TaxID=1862640 RepID=A0AAV8TTN9_9ROSI|nr:hypothetical protein K2173_011223 [Erythroxylum novogranatense]
MALLNRNSHLGLALLSVFLLFSVTNSENDPLSMFDVLPKYGLPSGLLPSTVSNYSLADDGRFVVSFENPCYVQFDYLVYYYKQITGRLSYGSITDLKGIQVRRLFLWFDVDEIKVDLPPSGSIYFKVGIVNKKLDVDQFKTVHSCQDEVSGSCGGLLDQILKLPAPVGDVEMLITE